MISITVNEMINIYGTLNELMSKNFSGKNAFNIARLARELNKELETFDQARKQVVDKYTLRDSAASQPNWTGCGTDSGDGGAD